jgi:hypothetical protein
LAFLAVLTLARPEWVVGIFGADLDAGAGTAEAALVVGLAHGRALA